jgi:hypothetical protein
MPHDLTHIETLEELISQKLRGKWLVERLGRGKEQREWGKGWHMGMIPQLKGKNKFSGRMMQYDHSASNVIAYAQKCLEKRILNDFTRKYK